MIKKLRGLDAWEKNGKSLDYDWKLTRLRQKGITDRTIKCKNCGHSIVPMKERIICTHCGRWVYKNDKAEFEYKLKEITKKL